MTSNGHLFSVVLFALALLPGSSAHAQTEPAPATKPAELPVSYPLLSPADAAHEQRIQAALAKAISFDWKGVALKDVISQLADACDITIVLTKKIGDAGVTPDQPVTRHFNKVPLRSVLRQILDDLELTYMIKDNVLKITTIGSCPPALSMTIRVYPVNDLVEPVRPSKDAKPALDFTPLIGLIEEIEPDSWQDVGGPGCVKGFDNAGCLFISQRDDIHERIDTLLITLRRVKAVQGLKTSPASAVPNRYLPAQK